MKNCLDLNFLLDKSKDPSFDIKDYGVDSLNEVLDASIEVVKESIKSHYIIFKQRVLDLFSGSVDNFDQFHTENRHLLWETHEWSEECNIVRQALFQLYQKLQELAEIRTMKVLPLFLKIPEFYQDIQDILHLCISVATKIHAEGVAESMGNFIDISDVGREAFINWNGPPVTNDTTLLELAK